MPTVEEAGPLDSPVTAHFDNSAQLYLQRDNAAHWLAHCRERERERETERERERERGGRD